MSSAVPLTKERRTGNVIVTFRPKSQNSFGPSMCHRVHAWIVALLVAIQDSFSLSGNAQTSRAGSYVVSTVAVYDALKVPASVQMDPVIWNTRTSRRIARSKAAGGMRRAATVAAREMSPTDFGNVVGRRKRWAQFVLSMRPLFDGR